MLMKLKQDTILRGWLIDYLENTKEVKDISYKAGAILEGNFILGDNFFFVYDEDANLEFWVDPNCVEPIENGS